MQKRKENKCHGCLLVVGCCIGCLLPHTGSLVICWTVVLKLQQESETAWRLPTAMCSPLQCSSAFAASMSHE